MSYIRGLYQYFSKGKGKLDFIDYLRAVLVMAAVCVVVHIAFFIFTNWLSLFGSML